MGLWCSGISSAPHAEGLEFNPQWVQQDGRHLARQLRALRREANTTLHMGSLCSRITSAPDAEDLEFDPHLVQPCGGSPTQRLRSHRRDVNATEGSEHGRMVWWYHSRSACGRPRVQPSMGSAGWQAPGPVAPFSSSRSERCPKQVLMVSWYHIRSACGRSGAQLSAGSAV